MPIDPAGPRPIDAPSTSPPDNGAAGSPPPAIIRWSVLVLASLAMFGNYYVYDSIAPLADHLQRMIGFTDTQLGTLNAIYSFPNILMVLIGGVVVDRVGTRKATVLFTAICVLGAVLTAASSSWGSGLSAASSASPSAST
jgi:nitrate/nitrite transporter NarK